MNPAVMVRGKVNPAVMLRVKKVPLLDTFCAATFFQDLTAELNIIIAILLLK